MPADEDPRISDVQYFLRDLARAFPHKRSAVAAAISELNTRTNDNSVDLCEFLSAQEFEVLRAILRLIMWWPFYGESRVE